MKKLILAFLLLAQPAWAKTIYVGPGGSNSTPCTTGGASGTGAQNPSSPKLTITEGYQALSTPNGGISCLAGGDTLIILGTGTYNEKIYHNGGSIVLSIGVNSVIPGGTAGNPTIIKGESTTTRPTLNPSYSGQVIFLKDSPNYIRFDSLIIDGTGAASCSGSACNNCIGDFKQADTFDILGHQYWNLEVKNCEGHAILWDPLSNGTELINSTVHDYNSAGYNNSNGLYAHGINEIIRGNTFYMTVSTAPQGNGPTWGIREGSNSGDSPVKRCSGNLIERNTVYNLGGCILFNGDNNIIRNNYCRDNFWGIWAWGGQINSNNDKVYHNTIIRSLQWALRAADIADSYTETGLKVYNNLLYQNCSSGSSVCSSDADGIDGAEWEASLGGNSNPTINPNLAGTNDVHLTATSAIAINTAAALPTGDSVTTDFDGNARPFGSASDVGADEFTSATPTITLVSPRVGDSWTVGSGQTITWTSSNLTGTITITEDRNSSGTDGVYEATVASGISISNTSQSYTVAGSAGSRRMRICDSTPLCDVSGIYTVTASAGGTLTKRLSGNSGSDLAGSEDTELWQPQASTNYANDATMSNSKFDASGHDYNLLRFPALSQIPSTATVSSVTLGLFLQGASSATAYTFDIRRVLRNWLENQATWNFYSGTPASPNNWTAAGGIGAATDRVSTASAQLASVTNTAQYWTVTDASGTLKSDVQNWVNGSVVNNGWHVELNGTAGGAYKVFTTTQGTDGQRPYLDVTYTIAAPTITLTQPSAGQHYFTGQTVPIHWQSQGISGLVQILVSRDGGFDYEELATNYPYGQPDFAWEVTNGKATSTALFKVVWLGDTSVSSISPPVRLGGKYRH